METSNWRLNLDILLVVMEHAEKTTVTKLMQACHMLHREGTKFILPSVELLDREQLTSFVSFMERASRSGLDSFLNSLQLEMAGPLHDETAGRLEKLLTRLSRDPCSKLQHLQLGDAEGILPSHPKLGATIASLTTLTSLEARNAGDHFVTLLDDLQSQLIRANIHWDDEEDLEVYVDGAWMGNTSRDFIRLLHDSSKSLETLEMERSWRTAPDGPIYPRLTSLFINHGCAVDVSHYLHAFPNLVDLGIYTGADNGICIEDWPEHREMNQQFQMECGSWCTLRHLGDSPAGLYLLGLTCHVPRIYTYMCVPFWSDYEYVQAVLSDVRPTTVELEVNVEGQDEEFKVDQFLAVFCVERSPQIERLKLELRLDGWRGDNAIASESVLNAVKHVSQYLRLRTLNIVLDALFLNAWNESSRTDATSESEVEDSELANELGSPTPRLPNGVASERMHLQEIAKHLKDSTPSLDFVSVSLMRLGEPHKVVELGTKSS